MSSHENVALALGELEQQLESAGLWQQCRPAPEAFESQQPFCVDSMTLPQWLRYVFVERLRALVDARAKLPEQCDVAPAMEVYLKDSTMTQKSQVISAIARVDEAVTRA